MSRESLDQRLEELWSSPPLSLVSGLARESGLEAALVGGAVRDLALGLQTCDLDLVVERRALEFARCCADRLGGSFVPLDELRGVARVVLADGSHVDIALRFGATLEEDLHCRDFTVDAVAHLPGVGLVDPTGGLEDLAAGRLRLCRPDAFVDDPLRMLRAVRLSARFGLCLGSEVIEAITRESRRVTSVSAERVRDEWFAIMEAGVSGQLDTLLETGLLFAVLPELRACREVPQNYFHHLDVLTHTLEVVRALERLEAGGFSELAPHAEQVRAHLGERLAGHRSRLVNLKLAAFLHDVSKPDTRSVGRHGRIHFWGHEFIGSSVAEGVARRLALSNNEVRYMRNLVLHHMAPVLLPSRNAGKRGLHRFLQQAGEQLPDLVVHSWADVSATRGPAQTPERIRAHHHTSDELLEEYFAQGRLASPPLPVTGRDLTEELGLAPGPIIGWLLDRLREACAEGGVSSREEALELASRWIFEKGSAGREPSR